MLSQVASQAAGSITDASNAISGAQGTVDAAPIEPRACWT